MASEVTDIHESHHVSRQRVTLTEQELLDGSTLGAYVLGFASHIAPTWISRHATTYGWWTPSEKLAWESAQEPYSIWVLCA